MINISGTITITAPSAADGFGGVAVLNDSVSSDFVGYLWKPGGFGGVNSRSSVEPAVEQKGAVFGDFWDAHREMTLDVLLQRSTTYALSDARYNKLCRATNAASDDGTIVWTDSDGVTKRVLFRREAGPSDPDEDGHTLVGIMAADPRIYANTATTGSSPTTNAGNTASPPTFTLTPSGGNVVITNSTTGLALTLLVGAPYVTTGSAVTVDFGARTVTQGGSLKQGSVSFPSSTWWEIIPGSNSWSVTNASSVSISVRSAWSNS